jgi:hypothetical protein
MVVGSNNYTYVLWRRTDGAISIYVLDAYLNLVATNSFGPYLGWIPESMSMSEDGLDELLIIWKMIGSSSGTLTDVWYVSGSTLQLNSSYVYGPYFGYSPSTVVAQDWKGSVSDDNEKAAASMAKIPTSTPGPMPHN